MYTKDVYIYVGIGFEGQDSPRFREHIPKTAQVAAAQSDSPHGRAVLEVHTIHTVQRSLACVDLSAQFQPSRCRAMGAAFAQELGDRQ